MDDTRQKKILDILDGNFFPIKNRDEIALALYDTALTHSSFANENKPCEDFERLEFLGNYFLDYVVAKYLYKSTEHAPKEMNNRLKVTENANLANIVFVKPLHIDDAILLGKGTTLTDKIIADSFEAFIGAILCCEKEKKAQDIVLGIFKDEIENFDPNSNKKGILQEYVATHKKGKVLEY